MSTPMYLCAHTSVSQRSVLENLLLFPTLCLVSTIFISTFEALYEHFACLNSLLNIPLCSLWPARFSALVNE